MEITISHPIKHCTEDQTNWKIASDFKKKIRKFFYKQNNSSYGSSSSIVEKIHTAISWNDLFSDNIVTITTTSISDDLELILKHKEMLEWVKEYINKTDEEMFKTFSENSETIS